MACPSVRRVASSISMLVCTLILICTSKSFATTGREAVGMCIDSTAGGARCAWSVNGKGEVDVCNKSGCVTCPSAEGTCTVAKTLHHPTRGIPVGATVTTELGTFKITPRVYTGPLLKVPEQKGSQQNGENAPTEKGPTGSVPAEKAPVAKAK